MSAGADQRPHPVQPLPAGLHRFSQMERVIHGRPVCEVLTEELAIVQRTRVFVVSNRSLAGSAALADIVRTLGPRCVGRFDAVPAHSPRQCAIDGAAAARACGADLLLAVGGGSVIDAAKAMLLCLRHSYTDPGQLEPHANVRVSDLGHAPDDADRWLRVIAVPTTLSGAEFAAAAGLTDPSRGLKQAFVHPMQMPQSVILDPALTLTAPLALLQATGMKALDHAVERLTSAAANPYSDAVSLLAVRLLGQGLPQLAPNPSDLALRARLQYGMFMSLAGSAAGVAVNVSHAIGHVLGAHCGVPHGQTSGLVLPAVLRWNHEATAAVQAAVCQALGRAGDDAAGAVGALVQALGLPSRLRDVGIAPGELPAIAAKTMHEGLLRNSRKPVGGAADVLALLQTAW